MGNLSESLPRLLAATVAFAIGTSVVLRDRERDEFVQFAVFCFNLGLFHLASFFHHFLGIQFLAWIAQSLSLILPWSADRCFSSLVPQAGLRARPRWRSVMLFAVLAGQVAVFVLLLTSSRSPGEVMDTRPWSFVALGLNIYVIVALLFSTMRIWRAAKAAQGTATAPRMRYLFYASLIALIFGSPLIPAVGPMVTAVYLYFVAQALMRERLLDLPETLSRIATLTALVVALTTLYAIFLFWIDPEIPGRVSLMLFNIAVASYATVVLVDPLRTEFESRIEHWMFRGRSQLRVILADLRVKLLNVIDPDEMVKTVIDTLERSNRVTRASVFLLDAQGRHLVLRAELGTTPKRRIDVVTQRLFVERLRDQGFLLRDVLQRELDRSPPDTKPELREVLDGLAQVGASLALPIITRSRDDEDKELSELIGILFVDDERLLEPFSREEVDIFAGLAAQAAITLQNSAAYEQRKERERLAALGEMSAGLAHEIRNPLGAIKGAVQVVDPLLSEDDATAREFFEVIVEEVDRLNRVVSQFLSYSRRHKPENTAVDLLEVLKATVRLIPAERASQIHLEVDEAIPSVNGDPESLRQVFHNLVLNALDATQEQSESPKIVIDSHLRPRGLPTGDAVAISVRDNGAGLSPHVLKHLFVPFHTTKSGGTGLGLPISQRIIQSHGGVIEAGNHSEGGAEFTLLLPVFPGTSES